MRLPARLHPPLLLARHLGAVAQGWWFHRGPSETTTTDAKLHVGSGSFVQAVPAAVALTRTTPLAQPDRTTCGSSVLVMMRLLDHPESLASLLADPDPAEEFGRRAQLMIGRTNSWRDRSGRLQLAWPVSLGTRPAALVRELGGGWTTRVVDPRRPHAAWEAMRRAGRPVPLYVGEGSWMQHIVLVTAIDEGSLTVYEPARGEEVRRSRAQFETATLEIAGWDQPWLVVTPTTADVGATAVEAVGRRWRDIRRSERRGPTPPPGSLSR